MVGYLPGIFLIYLTVSFAAKRFFYYIQFIGYEKHEI